MPSRPGRLYRQPGELIAETISSNIVYKGKVFDVHCDQICEGDAEYSREIVRTSGSAVVLPVFDDNTVGLVRQYRHPAKKYLLEIAAGGLEPGETPEQGAARELEEEVGVTAEKLEKLTEFYPSPGFLDEKMHLFLATGLTETSQDLDEDEYVEIERLTFADAFERIGNGGIEDGKTIIGIILAAKHLGLSFENA